MNDTSDSHYIGLMSGTSLDGVDAVLTDFSSGACRVIASASIGFDDDLKQELLRLNTRGDDEIVRSHLAANELARLYADCVAELLAQTGLPAATIRAIGCHGQTVRHRPELGFTVQIGNAALLAELSGIAVVGDFRSRDVAAGGQGAPLVPAFHQAVFGDMLKHRAVVNIGGIANISDLPAAGAIRGFDTGPGNLLMDGWIARHLGVAYDRDGAWAVSGRPIPELLQALRSHPFFRAAPPKSTGRDDFHLGWLEPDLRPDYAPADVQATLLELSASSIADAVSQHCGSAQEIYLCGGGGYNGALVNRLTQLLQPRIVTRTDALGIPANQVEAAAFAWLARQALLGLPGNLPAVTGARGPRILGAIYPA